MARKPTKAELGRMLMNSGWTEDELSDPEVLRIRQELEREAQEEEERKANPFDQVQGRVVGAAAPPTPPPQDEGSGWGTLFSGNGPEQISESLRAALAQGGRRAAGGLLTISSDVDAIPEAFGGDVVRASEAFMQEQFPGMHSTVAALRGGIRDARDAVMDPEAMRQAEASKAAGLDAVREGAPREVVEALQDFSGSPTSALSVIGGPYSAGITALDVYGQEYMDATMNGVDPETARTRAGAMAALEGGVSAIPAGQFLSRIPGVRNVVGRAGRDLLKDDLAKLAIRTGRNVAGEAAEEGVTAAAQFGVDAALNYASDDQATQAFTAQNTVDFWNTVWRSAKAGAVGGGVIGAPVSSFEISAEAGRLAAKAKQSNAEQKRGLANRRDAERARLDEVARIEDEKAAAFEQAEQSGQLDPQRLADEREAAYRTMDRQREADALRQGASLDQVPGPMQAAFQNVKVTPVTAEEVAAERTAAQNEQNRQAKEGEALKQRVTAMQDKQAKAKIQELIDKDTATVQKKATSMRNSARRKALQGIMDDTRTLTPEERVSVVQERVDAWEAENPIENYVTQATAKPVRRAPAQGKPRVTRPAPVAQPTTPAVQVTEEEEAPAPAPKRDFKQIKSELGLSSVATAPTANAAQGVSSEQALNVLTQNVAKGDAKKVLKLVADGNAVIIDNESDVPEGAVPAGDTAAYYDGNRTYIIANQLDPENVMGDLLKYAAHEVKHAADLSGNKTLKATMGQFIGEKANADIVSKIEKLAAAGNPLAQEVVQTARENSVPESYALELPAYWINAAMEQREMTGTPRRVVNDIVSAVRTKYRQMKGDQDVNLKDVSYLARKLLEETGLSGQRLEGDLPTTEALPTIAGGLATGIEEARKAGITYKSVDGQEKFLFSDADMDLKPTRGWHADLLIGQPVELDKIVKHDELFKQYPEAKTVKVAVDSRLPKNIGGYYSNTDRTIYLHPARLILDDRSSMNGPYSELMDLLIHEMQHYVQFQEGHALGGNASMFYTKEDDKLIDQYNQNNTKVDGFVQLLQTKTSRERVFGDGVLGHFVGQVMNNIKANKITTAEGFADIAAATDAWQGDVPAAARIMSRGMLAAIESNRNLGAQVGKIFDRQYQQYLDLLGETEARFTADNRWRTQENLPTNPEEEEAGSFSGFDRPIENALLMRTPDRDGKWAVKNRAGETVIDSENVATADNSDPRSAITQSALASAASRFSAPNNRATRTLTNYMKMATGQVRTYGNLGQELGVMKEEADGEAALHAHRAMNYFNWLNRGVSRMARAGVKAGTYRNRAEGEEAVKELIRQKMEQIAAMDDETRREAALAAFVKQNPELDGLMAAVQEVRQLSRTLLKQMVTSIDNPTNDELAMMNTIMDNSFRYTTQMYAAFQGPAGRIHSQQLIDEYDRALQIQNKGKQIPNKLDRSFNTYKNAMKYLIDNDLTIPEGDELESSSTKKLAMLYDTWIGDASRLMRTTKEKGIADGLTIRNADQLVRDTMIAALEEKAPGIKETDYEGKARDLILGMLELSNEGGPFASYYRGFKQDRSILERRTGLPQEIKDLFGEITDPATRLAVTIAKQGELAARTRMLLDMRDNGTGKWVIPPSQAGLPGNEDFTATLQGENYGPLNGYRTTPEIAAAISDNLEMFSTLGDALAQSYQNSQPAIEAAGRMGIKALKGTAAWQKILSVVFDLYNMGTNFVGSFVALGANGVNPKYWTKGGRVALDVIADSIWTKSGQLSPGFEDAIKYGVLDSARVQEIRKTPQRFVKELISVEPKAVRGTRQALGKLRSGTVETFAMSDAWVKIAAFQERTDHLTKFYKAEGVSKSEEEIKKEAADQIKNTNITYSRTPPLVRNLESVGITTFMPYFVSVPRAITHNLVLGIQDTVRATGAKTTKGKMMMWGSGIKRVSGAYAASVGMVYLTKALAAMFNDDDEDKLAEMQKLMYPDARFADSFFLGYDQAKNPLFARFSRVDPFGPANDLLRIAVDDSITPEEKRRHLTEMLRDMVITNRVVVAGARAITDFTNSEEDLKNKKVKLERVAPKATEYLKDLMGKIPTVDYSETESVIQFMDSFTPGFADMFDPKNRPVESPKGEMEGAMGDLIGYSGGRLDVADPGQAAWRVGQEVKKARDEGRGRLAAGVAAGRDHKALAEIFVDAAAKEQTALQEAARVYEGMTRGLGLTPRQAMAYLKDDADLTQSDIANIRQGRVNQELEEWLNGGTRMLSKSSLRERSDEGLSDAEKAKHKEDRKAFVQAMRALGYKVREK